MSPSPTRSLDDFFLWFLGRHAKRRAASLLRGVPVRIRPPSLTAAGILCLREVTEERI